MNTTRNMHSTSDSSIGKDDDDSISEKIFSK